MAYFSIGLLMNHVFHNDSVQEFDRDLSPVIFSRTWSHFAILHKSTLSKCFWSSMTNENLNNASAFKQAL
jgi:hypothetical protein